LATAALRSSRNSEQLSPRLTLRRQLGKSYNSSLYLCSCSKGQLQRGLGVGCDSFSDSASQGVSASSSSVLQHQCSALVIPRQQQHLYFSFFSFDSISIQHRTYVSVSILNVSTAWFSSSSTSKARPATQHQEPFSSSTRARGSIQQLFSGPNTSAAAASHAHQRQCSINVQQPELRMHRQQQRFCAASAAIGFSDNAPGRQCCVTAGQQ
jgi:hypothetical protein